MSLKKCQPYGFYIFFSLPSGPLAIPISYELIHYLIFRVNACMLLNCAYFTILSVHDCVQTGTVYLNGANLQQFYFVPYPIQEH